MSGAEWRIRECSYGGVVAEYGFAHPGGVIGPAGVGVTMPAFVVYEKHYFDTEKQAEKFINQKKFGGHSYD